MNTDMLTDYQKVDLIADLMNSMGRSALNSLSDNLLKQVNNSNLKMAGMDKSNSEWEDAVYNSEHDNEIISEQVYFAQELLDQIENYVSELVDEKKLSKKYQDKLDMIIENSYFER